MVRCLPKNHHTVHPTVPSADPFASTTHDHPSKAHRQPNFSNIPAPPAPVNLLPRLRLGRHNTLSLATLLSPSPVRSCRSLAVVDARCIGSSCRPAFSLAVNSSDARKFWGTKDLATWFPKQNRPGSSFRGCSNELAPKEKPIHECFSKCGTEEAKQKEIWSTPFVPKYKSV